MKSEVFITLITVLQCSNLKKGKMYQQGDKVLTPGGVGTIVYCRMEPPTYSTISCYSVQLNSKTNGTIYLPQDITLLPADYQACGTCGFDHAYEYEQASKVYG